MSLWKIILKYFSYSGWIYIISRFMFIVELTVLKQINSHYYYHHIWKSSYSHKTHSSVCILYHLSLSSTNCSFAIIATKQSETDIVPLMGQFMKCVSHRHKNVVFSKKVDLSVDNIRNYSTTLVYFISLWLEFGTTSIGISF